MPIAFTMIVTAATVGPTRTAPLVLHGLLDGALVIWPIRVLVATLGVGPLVVDLA